MATIEARVKPEFASQYPQLATERWYQVNQGAREIDSDQASALHVESDGDLVEVDVHHIVRRNVGEEV